MGSSGHTATCPIDGGHALRKAPAPGPAPRGFPGVDRDEVAEFFEQYREQAGPPERDWRQRLEWRRFFRRVR